MVNIEKLAKEISKKQNYSMITKEEVYKYALELAKKYNIVNEDKLKREVIIDLDKINKTLWDVREDDEYFSDEKLNAFVDKIIKDEKYEALTISASDLKQLSYTKNSIEEYFECRDIFKTHNLPERNVINIITLPKKIKTRILSNLNEENFEKIIKNNYCELFVDIDKNNGMSNKEKEEFVKIININNNSPMFIPCENDLKKDTFHINTLQDLKNIDDIKANKLEELMNDKYSVYDIKREFCNRFMNIDPIVLENCLYCLENKETLENMKDLDLIKQIVNINLNNKKEMIDIYSRYMYGSKSINIPDNLITYGYIYATPEEVKELRESNIDYSQDKFYHEIYFCRECLLDSNQKKRDRELQLEIPIGVLRNNKQISYENVVRNNIYNPNMAYPKIELRKEEIDSKWVKRDYLTLEAINSNVDINNPKRFDKEIPMSKNYSHLYDSYMYKEEYDRKEKEKKDNELEEEMEKIFGTVGLTTNIVKQAMLNNRPPEEDDPII